MLNLGARLDTQCEWLFNGGLNSSQFKTWADNSCKIVRLDIGSAMWIPYGWYAASLARPGPDDYVSWISQPYINKQLASQCKDWAAVSADQVQMTQSAMQAGSPKSYVEFGQTWMEWLRSDASPVACAEPQPAIADEDT